MDPSSRLQQYHAAKDHFLHTEESLLDVTASHVISDAAAQLSKQHHDEFNGFFTRTEESFAAMKANMFVEPDVLWNRKRLAQECSFVADTMLLSGGQNDQQRSSWDEVVNLSSTLNTLKRRGYISPKQVHFVEEIEKKIRTSYIERRDLRRITEALSTKLSEEIENQMVNQDVSKHSVAISELTPDLDNFENLLETALLNGDMAQAEEVANNQIRLLERLLEVTEEQYPILKARKDNTKEFMRRRRWAIFRMANKDINGLIELKFRQVEACEDDALKLKLYIEQSSATDTTRREKFDEALKESDSYLESLHNETEESFDKINALIREVRNTEDHINQLCEQRRQENARRITMLETENARSNGHHALLASADDHFTALQQTIENAEQIRDMCKALNDFILDGCDNVALKFDRTESSLNDMMHLIDKQYLKMFSDYATCVGRHMYRKGQRRARAQDDVERNKMSLELCVDTLDAKAKKYAEQRDASQRLVDTLTKEIDGLRGRVEKVSHDFEHCAASLQTLGIPFVHPMQLMEEVNLNRRERVVNYRDRVNITEAKVEQQLEADMKSAQNDLDIHRVLTMQKQEAMHRRHVHSASARGPKPPASYAEKVHANAFTRYRQVVKEMQLDGAPPASSRPQSAPATKVPQAATPQDRKPEAPEDVAPLPARLEGETVVAMYAYRSHAADELSFSKGDRIVCVQAGQDPGWYFGVVNQRMGVFPLNYVRLADNA